MEELKLGIEIIQKIIDDKVVQSLYFNINGVSIPFIPSDIDIDDFPSDEGIEISHEEFFQRLENTRIHNLANKDSIYEETENHSLLSFLPEEIRVGIEHADIDVYGVTVELVQLEINEKLIPSIDSVMMILHALKDTDSKKIFCDSSNDFILKIICDYAPEHFVAKCEDPRTKEYVSFQRLSLTLHEWCCHLLGDLDFIYYLESKAVISWFHFMMANSRSYHLPKLVRQLPLIIKSELGEIYLDESEKNIVKDYPLLEKYPEYKKARRNFDIMNLLFRALAMRILWWLIMRAQHQQILYFKDKKETGYRVFICPYCKCCKQLSPGVKEAVDCGEPECKTKHGTKIKSQTRPPKRSIPQGWIKAYDGKPRSCSNISCGEKRVLYVEELNQHLVESLKLCQECRDEKIVTESAF